ncbi:MAG: hypothetical protein ABI165_12090, partial [Bryobacteraceae bacterium]
MKDKPLPQRIKSLRISGGKWACQAAVLSHTSRGPIWFGHVMKEQSAGCEIRYDLEEPRKATA